MFKPRQVKSQEHDVEQFTIQEHDHPEFSV